jgi:hypothetical protein
MDGLPTIVPKSELLLSYQMFDPLACEMAL